MKRLIKRCFRSRCRFATWAALTVVTSAATPAWSHDGRRFEVQVVENQLIAQGTNTGADDGRPAVRPYTSSIHDHWRNSPLIGVEAALAIAPEFDVVNPPASLTNRPLYLSLASVKKWRDPPMMPAAGLQPVFEALAPGEVVSVGLGTDQIDSLSLGDLLLVPSVPSSGVLDLALQYQINRRPQNEIYVLEMMLSSPLSSIADSDAIYVILSPDGASAAEKLHHASLYLEAYLGNQVPEPNAFGLALIAVVVCCRTPRRLRASR